VSRPLGSKMVDWIANNIGTITKTTETKKGRKTDRQKDIQKGRQTDKQRDKQTDIKTNRLTDRQID